MAAVEITISGTLYDKLNRTTQQVVLIGEASLTGLGIGGGPIIPPGKPPVIWGGPIDPYPDIGGPGPQPPAGAHPSHPIALPGDPWWPKPPDAPVIPPPGSPPVVLPGPAPIQPIVPPPAIIVDYPGVGRVLVPQPATETAAPK